MNHYFKSNENLKHKERETEYIYKFKKFVFITDSGVFSKDGVDFATNILLENLPDDLSGDILDIGCGCGCVGIVLAKIYGGDINISVTMSDINDRAVNLAKKNAEKNGVSKNVKIIKSDGFEYIPGNFANIILNPPIHAGKGVIYKLYEEAHEHLNPNGRFFIVIQKKHGALSHKTKLEEIFGNCVVLYSKKGFFVLEAARTRTHCVSV